MKSAKRYRISESELFNLESMREHLINLRDDARENGDVNTEEKMDDRIEEIEYLLDQTHGVGSLVAWPVLKHIREIKEERQMIRYNTCLTAGSSEQDAALAFTL